MTVPRYLRGHLAPVTSESEAHELPVDGAIPPELNGRYFRNGPNPRPGQRPPHWFAGDGMLHGVRLRAGRAEWYRNRWVRTAAFAGAPFIGPNGRVDRAAVTANTNVIRHADRILALVESGLPYEVSPELETLGRYDFDGRLTTAMTAHPKRDPLSGELHFFGYGALRPHLTYHRASADGALVESASVPVPGPTMMHDFAITARHVVWLDLPVVFDPGLLGGGLPYRWDDDYGARIGVMRRDGSVRVRWFDIEPCYAFHVGNASEEPAGRLVLDAVSYPRDAFVAFWSSAGGFVDPIEPATTTTRRLHRWTLDLAAGRVSEQQIDDRPVEFPTINDDLVGCQSRYRYAVHATEIVKYDLLAGASRTYDAGAEQAPGEAVFVASADGSAEDAGWLLSIVSDLGGRGSRLLILDATEMTRVASVDLPHRVPAGFHGNWLPDTATRPR